MPAVTRSMKSKSTTVFVSQSDLEVAEILCQLKNASVQFQVNQDDIPSLADSDTVFSGHESDYEPSVTESEVVVNDKDSEYEPSVNGNEVEMEDNESEYEPSVTESEVEDPDYEPSVTESEAEDSEYEPSVTESEAEDSEYEPSVTESEVEDPDYEQSEEDIAESIIRSGCRAHSTGMPLDRQFFRVCMRIRRGDYSPSFAKWALQIGPVRNILKIR